MYKNYFSYMIKKNYKYKILCTHDFTKYLRPSFFPRALPSF